MRNKSTSDLPSLTRPATPRRKFAAFTVAAMLLVQHLLILAPSQASAQILRRAKTSAAPIAPMSPTAGSVSLTTLGSAYTQNFDTLSNTAGSTTNDLTITGWYMTESGGGTRDNEQYAVDTGGSNTGDTYSYGATSATDRALGGLQSGTLVPTFGASFTNDTGSTVTSLDIAYAGEEWRLGTTARTDQINFEYSANATDLTTGTWTGVSALNFVTPDTGTVGAKNGNAAADRTAISSTISGLNIPNGATFWIRWTDTNASSSDDGLAVDDFSLTPNAAAGPPSLSIDDVSQNEGNSGTTTFTFTVGLSSPAPVGGVTFDIATADGTATAPGDYTAKSLTGQTIPQGSTSYTFDASVNGDTDTEPNETFFVNVTNVTGATVTDGQGQGTIVNDDAVQTSPTVSGSASPSTVQAGNSTLLTATVTPGTNPASTGISVSADLSSIGGSATQAMYDDGTSGDVAAGDNVFSYNATVSAATSAGAKSLAVSVSDAQSRSGSGSISLTVTAAAPVGQPLPFSQDWSNTNLISVNDDWSGVPGITGYLGDTLTSSTGVDPQTLLADSSNSTVDVIANQSNPNTLTNGGVAEFEITNPTIALQGSGSGDAPHIVVSLNTTGANNIVVSYNLIDVDGSADNSVQPVALQYRVGASGNYTNIPSAFVADATDGPSLSGLTTPVSVLLPAAAENQSLVQLRIMTNNAIGADEWVGVDDINVSSGGTIPLGATGSASPSNVLPGGSTLLKATVNPATNPSSTGISVVGDLSAIGGSATQAFFDDGTNGDQTPGDNVFSYNFTVGNAVASDIYSLPVSVGDAEMRTTSTVISLTVGTIASGEEHLTMGNPSAAVTDVNSPLNYLMLKPQYALSYNRDQGKPNWVSWHLDSTWIGSAPRQNDFRPDDTLPAGWYQVQNTDYSGSGFDRGHNVPSGDRTRSVEDNSATFLMTNMMPQAPDNNQGPWEAFESYCRTVAGSTNELYIVTGSVGVGGTGSNGLVTTIAGGNVTVPEYTWKVVIILPIGSNDVSRVTTATRTIGIIMPNKQGIRTDAWQKYLATVDQVEALTGDDFFSNVPVNIQDAIESKLDTASNTSPQSIGAGTFTDLAVDGPNTTLTGDITVNGVLTLGGSTLYTNGHKITLGPNATVRRISGMVDGTVEKQFDSVTDFQFPVGTGPFAYSPVTMSLTALGSVGSKLAVTPFGTVHPSAPDPTKALKRYWTLTETGDLTGNLTFKYLDADVPGAVSDETSMGLYRYEGAFSPYYQTIIDAAANTDTTTTPVSSFSDWTLMGPLAPTAGGVTVSGRVTRSDGYPLANATVQLVGPDGHTYSARSNTFGYFQVQGVPAGKVYIANAARKGYSFAPRTLTVDDGLSGLAFVAQP